MKRIAAFVCATFLFTSFINAQNSPSTNSTKQPAVKTDPEFQKQIQGQLLTLTEKLNGKLQENHKANKTKYGSYVPSYKHQPGDLNLFPLWEEIPLPVSVLPEAVRINADNRFSPYRTKVERAQKDFSALALKHNKYNQIYQTEGEEGLKKRAVKDINSNPIIADMGGAEKVAKMSESEARAAAMAAYNKQMQQPSSAMGAAANPAMNKLMQDMIKDPALAEKFEAMSDNEKQEFLKSYFSKSVPRDDAKFQQTTQQQKNIRNAMQLTQFLSKTQLAVQEINKQYLHLQEQITQEFNLLYEKIESWYKKRYDAIPMKLYGEGYFKDHEQTGPLARLKAELIYEANKREAELLGSLWIQNKTDWKLAMTEFNEFIGQYKWENQQSALFGAADADAHVPQVIFDMYNQMLAMTNEAERLTLKNKSRQEQYESVLNAYKH